MHDYISFLSRRINIAKMHYLAAKQVKFAQETDSHMICISKDAYTL